MEEDKKQPAKVFICIPSLSGWVHTRLVQSIFAQMSGSEVSFMVGTSPVAKARNDAIKSFLKTDCTHIWFIDDDTVPKEDALQKLLALDADIASGVTPVMINGEITTNVFRTNDTKDRVTVDEIKKEQTPFSVAGVGASCLLIKRSVIEDTLKQPYFAELWFEEGEFCSEDIYFCNKATDAGLTIIVEPTVTCRHAKEVLL